MGSFGVNHSYGGGINATIGFCRRVEFSTLLYGETLDTETNYLRSK